MQNPSLASTGIHEFMRAPPPTYTGFLESDRFPKVLQGQEIGPLRSLAGKSDFNLGSWGKSNLGCNLFMYQKPKPNFYPLASEGIRNMYFPYNDIYKGGQDPVMLSYASNFPRENVPFNPPSIHTRVIGNEVRKPNIPNEQKPPENIPAPPTLDTNLKHQKDDTFSGNATGCKLFGFSLTGENSGKRSCTKVRCDKRTVGFQFASLDFLPH